MQKNQKKFLNSKQSKENQNRTNISNFLQFYPDYETILPRELKISHKL